MAFTLCLQAHGAVEYSQLPDPFAAVQNPCEDIRNGQFACKDCATLGFCLQQNNQWNFLEMGTCQTERGFFCDENALGCVLAKECKLKTRGPKFECQNIGIYPDPYDCKFYHKCNANNEDERLICPTGTAYSPASKSCSLSATAEICMEPQYNCTQFGEMGAWPSDANIYYFCTIKLGDGGDMIKYPMLYRCQDGYEFSARYSKCMPAAPLATPATTAAATKLPASTTATTVLPTSPATCLPDSNLIPDPKDCHSFFVCAQGQLVPKSCPAGTYFLATKNVCEFGNC